MNLVVVFAGGGIGACARYLMQGLVYRWTGTGFPYGTLAVNVLGSLIIGLLMASMEERFLVNPSVRLFLTVGILGGFTTFSSFSYETIALFLEGSIAAALANAGLNLMLCLAATWIGIALGRLI
ncbi:MAG: fluoride efflux transporter CrcB [Bacteroidota bacterium]